MMATIPEDLHQDILENLPPDVETLAHASLVCREWRRNVNDPGFLHRLVRRYHVRHGIPLTLGFFHNVHTLPRPFIHVGEVASMSFERFNGINQSWTFMDCQHGRVLVRVDTTESDTIFLVWHPMTGGRQLVMVKIERLRLENYDYRNSNATLICAAGGDMDTHHLDWQPTSPFRVVVLHSDSRANIFAGVFSSLTGQWSAQPTSVGLLSTSHIRAEPCVVVGNIMYQPLYDYRILSYDMEKGILTAFERPRGGNVRLMKADGGTLLGLATAKELTLRLWVHDVDTDDGWVLRTTVDLGEVVTGLLEAPLPRTDSRFLMMPPVKIIGVAEEGDILFLWTMVGIFMLWPKLMELKKVHETAEGMEIMYP